MTALAPLPATEPVASELSTLIADFFDAVTFPAGGAPGYERLRDLFVPQGLLIRNSGDNPEVSDVTSFIHERSALVLAGRLTEFEEYEISADTERWGNVAHRLSAYGKRGVQDGEIFRGRGIITTQLVSTSTGWRISSMAWDDERPGLSLPA